MNLIVKILVLVFVISACGDGRELEIPEDVIPRDTMASALLDMHLIEGAKVGQKIMGDTLKATHYYEKMYHKYGISKEQFDRSFQFYSEHPEVMNNMYKEVIERLNKIQQAPPRTPLSEGEPVKKDSASFTKPLTGSMLKKKLDSASSQQP